MKKKEEMCENCCNPINKEIDKYVFLGTYHGSDTVLEEKYYHFECWQYYFKQCVSARVQDIQKKAMGFAKNLMTGVNNNG